MQVKRSFFSEAGLVGTAFSNASFVLARIKRTLQCYFNILGTDPSGFWTWLLRVSEVGRHSHLHFNVGIVVSKLSNFPSYS